MSGGSNGRVRRRGEALRRCDGDVPTRKASRPVGRAPSVKLWRVRSTLAVKIRPGRSATGFLESVREARQLIRDPYPKSRSLGRGRISSSNRRQRQTHVRNSPDPCRKISRIDESTTRRLAEFAIFSRERCTKWDQTRIFSNGRSHEEGGAAEEKALTQAHNEGIRRRTRTRTQLQRSCTMSSM